MNVKRKFIPYSDLAVVGASHDLHRRNADPEADPSPFVFGRRSYTYSNNRNTYNNNNRYNSGGSSSYRYNGGNRRYSKPSRRYYGQNYNSNNRYYNKYWGNHRRQGGADFVPDLSGVSFATDLNNQYNVMHEGRG